jgi:hypothetical protein
MLGFDALGTTAIGDESPDGGDVPVLNGDHAHFQFTGVAYSYTADFTWASTQVSGWNATGFGTPDIKEKPVTGFMPVSFGPITIKEQYVSGFAPVNFGTPLINNVFQVTGFYAPVNFGTPDLAVTVVGFKAANLGMPGLALNAVGFNPVNFGAVVAKQRNRVTSWRACQLGTPTVPTNRTCAVSGFLAIHHQAIVPIDYIRYVRKVRVRVYRVRPVAFGTPSL